MRSGRGFPDHYFTRVVRSHACASYAKRRQYHDRRVDAARNVVRTEMAAVWDSSVFDEIGKVYLNFEQKYQGTRMKLGFFNTSAPGVIRKDESNFAYDMLGALVNQGTADNMGLVLGPTFCTTKGQVWKQEANINERLANSNLNIDRSWILTFEHGGDTRDERPLLYIGKIGLPGNGILKKSAWANSSILSKTSQIGPVMQQKTGDMIEKEELVGENPKMPVTTDPTTHMSPSEKVHQIGPGACYEILAQTFQGANVPTGVQPLVVDVHPHVGDMIKAFFRFRSTAVNKVKLLTYAAGPQHKQWLDENIQQWLITSFLSGEVTVSGAVPLAEEMPQDMLAAEIAPPTLMTCVWAPHKLNGVAVADIPEKDLKRFGEHSNEDIRNRFAVLRESSKKLGFNQPPAGDDAIVSPSKRRRVDPNPSPGNEPKTEYCIDNSEMPTAAMYSIMHTNREHTMKLIATDNEHTYLSNESPQATPPWITTAGFVVCQWTGGTWRKASEDKPILPEEIDFRIGSSEVLIFLGSRLMTVTEAMDEQRKRHPGAHLRVTYHTSTDDPQENNPGHATFEQKVTMAWKPEKTEIKDEGNGPIVLDRKKAAIAVPPRVWATGRTCIAWHMRWAMQGLAPVKPVVILASNIEIPSGKAAKLSN